MVSVPSHECTMSQSSHLRACLKPATSGASTHGTSLRRVRVAILLVDIACAMGAVHGCALQATGMFLLLQAAAIVCLLSSRVLRASISPSQHISDVRGTR